MEMATPKLSLFKLVGVMLTTQFNELLSILPDALQSHVFH